MELISLIEKEITEETLLVHWKIPNSQNATTADFCFPLVLPVKKNIMFLFKLPSVAKGTIILLLASTLLTFSVVFKVS